MAMIDNAIRTANDAFDAKRASIVESIKVAHRAAGTPYRPPAPSPWTSSEDDPQLSMLLSQPTNLEILAEQNTPLGTSKVRWMNVGRCNTDQPGDDEPHDSQLSPEAPPPTHQPPTSFFLPESPAQPPARKHAQHGGAHPGLPERSLWTPPVNNYRPSNTRSSHHPSGAPPNNTYPPYFTMGPRACYDKDSVRYGGARDTYDRTSHPSGSCNQAPSPSGPCSPHGPDSSLEYHRGHTGIPNDSGMSVQFVTDIGFQDTSIQNKVMCLFHHIQQSWYNQQYNSFGPQKESILKSTIFST
jgi:hypothetical protein